MGWHQIYGQFIHESFKTYRHWFVWLSVPCTYATIYGVKLITEYFDGKMWPARMLTFSCGVILFTVLTSIYFNEKLDVKNGTILALSCIIIALQTFWR